MEVILRHVLSSILAAPCCQGAPGTYGFDRKPVQVQCHPSQVSEALWIYVLQWVYGVGNLLDDTLSSLYVTKCPHEYGTVISIGHVL